MLQGVAEGDVRSLHRARVASRRLREVVPILELDRDETATLSRRLRKVTRRLGTVRELDVLLQSIDRRLSAGRDDEQALAQVAEAITRERTAAHERLRERLPLAELQKVAAKIARVEERLAGREEKGRSSTRGWRWAIDARVEHRAAVLKSAVEAAGAVYLPDRVHQVRIALKKFRYSVELENETSPDRTWSQDLKALKRVQELLGRLHDRQVLLERIRQVQVSLSPPDLVLWRGLDNLIATIEKECRRLHARYVHDAVELGALCDRMAVRVPAPPATQRAG